MRKRVRYNREKISKALGMNPRACHCGQCQPALVADWWKRLRRLAITATTQKEV